jgi:NAD(P)H-dependent flavin oxidoreductase YrpB (nitropropane dioxygenase family)
VWLHQCGSVEEARAAREAGADGVIAQGCEAGGHVRGETPALDLLAAVRGAFSDDFPVMLAGGIAERDDVRRALEAGAVAAVLGTRFLLTPESGAHPLYRRRLLDAQETVRTELFGVGWPGAHRVVPNAATRRWLRSDPLGPRAVRRLHRLSASVVARAPAGVHDRLVPLQRAGLPLFSPVAPTRDGPPGLLDAGPLYAGETVARISDVRPAGGLVEELTP